MGRGMRLQRRLRAVLASQLGHPRGPLGRVVALRLNRSNRIAITAAIDRLGDIGGATVADIGFGGGVGLEVLLERVGPSGRVHGIDVSRTMLARAQRRFSTDVADGRLHLRAGSLTDLPLADGSLDASITVNTIYFIPELDSAFSELARTVKPSCRVVLGIGDPVTMAKSRVTDSGFRIRPVTEVVSALENAGLTLIEDERVGDSDGARHLLVTVRSLANPALCDSD